MTYIYMRIMFFKIIWAFRNWSVIIIQNVFPPFLG